MSMRVGHIELFCTDTLASRDFYRDVLGFEVTAVQNDRFVWVRLGDFEILLRPGSAVGTPLYGDAFQAIVLYTSTLDVTRARLEGRDLEFREPDGSEGCLTFTDPDGHWFQLVDPGDH